VGECREPHSFDFGENTGSENYIGEIEDHAKATSKDKTTKTKEGVPVGETTKITMQGRANSIITPDMLFIDKEEEQRPPKEIKTLELVFPKIPTKDLYKLHISVARKFSLGQGLMRRTYR
jgi:hypothetical protein